MAKDPEESASSGGRKMLGKLKDNGRTVNGMISNGTTGPGMSPNKPEDSSKETGATGSSPL